MIWHLSKNNHSSLRTEWHLLICFYNLINWLGCKTDFHNRCWINCCATVWHWKTANLLEHNTALVWTTSSWQYTVWLMWLSWLFQDCCNLSYELWDCRASELGCELGSHPALADAPPLHVKSMLHILLEIAPRETSNTNIKQHKK